MIHLLKLRCKFTERRFSFYSSLHYSFSFHADISTCPTDGRASRKCHRKTLLYISGLGMMIFIFIAAILVRNMEGFSSTHSFLDAPRSTANQTRDSIEAVGSGSHLEISLLISILCYNSFCALGVIILPWTLISELYPIQVRTKASMKGVRRPWKRGSGSYVTNGCNSAQKSGLSICYVQHSLNPNIKFRISEKSRFTESRLMPSQYSGKPNI